ncbi:MAG: Asp-tRNA(Asn)/Glu-tRNA(Gln) amidotransferase subunit GatB [Gemmatimonadetes bacterium]|jgi:aspartyl-tRNA(Asn)/glutamyl-tRNA(Gln) amidotransferase subunit B|nr:Asp-tRNA(Asn)/Glu-tRNA(Gln) amidotransferase subunit GatB [Gemmatimonadota bacterium]MBT6144993.1 Asp-tRNA(Asn)/Glu-tRNA(Gln) amidotransferase subunit GatB [Gemmatimonadota bacterium]MBT7862366.1 Asp-tRNA(Asn)/Glu-tRNA(Gln) amidotransferase subunit GatB [Gemmatimonadota bacterium]
MKYETVIGMEVHVELHTESKMFCACPAHHFQVGANEHVCPVCTAQPGALPVINGRALELTAMTGLALHCQVRPHSVFARKNYVYPDLPKGYQISQYELPICEDGWVDIDLEGGTKRIGIVRVHLEEDTGKLVHESNASLVDYNRAGVPLMEIVTDATLRSADEAFAYVQRIRQIVRYLDASTGDMEKGAMRCEANISVRPEGSDEFGTKVEVKNLNSFRSVRNAIDYEVKRQIEVIGEGGAVRQVTMGWDEGEGFTREQRSKEYADDYRYFPEPDLLDVRVDDAWMQRVEEHLPEMPDAKATRFVDAHGLGSEDAAQLAEDRAVAEYFEAVVAGEGVDPKTAANWMTGEFFRRLKETDEADIATASVRPGQLAQLLKLIGNDTISGSAAKDVFGIMWETGDEPDAIVEAKGLKQISDSSELESAVDDVISEQAEAADKVRGGDEKPIQFLMGQVMRATRGKANPQLVQQLLRERLLP